MNPVVEALSASIQATHYYLLIWCLGIDYSPSWSVPAMWNLVKVTDWNTLLAAYAAVICRLSNCISEEKYKLKYLSQWK